jgi:predicted transcriptional regulator
VAEPEIPNLTALTVDLLSAYLSNNTLASEDLAALVQTTHAALAKTNAPADEAVAKPEYVPAVSVRKSIASPDKIISLIDGKPYKTLKRHLSSQGLTIADYKARYNLPANYPMVAPTYSEHRRNVANKLGLGRQVKKSAPVSAAPEKKTAALTAPTPAPAVSKKPAQAKPAAVKTVATKPAKPDSTKKVSAPAAKSTPTKAANNGAGKTRAPKKKLSLSL